MKSITLILSFVSLLIIGCTTINNQLTYVEEEIAIDQWVKSPDAKKGYIFISGMMTPVTSSNILKKMIELNSREEVERITLIINTNGGEANSYRSIINGIKMTQKPVDVINIGSCYSAGVGVFAAASGKRYAFPKTHFMIHRPNPDEWKVGVEDGVDYELEIYESVIKKNTNLPEKWFPLSERLIFFSAEEAKKYNLVDEIITELP